MNSQDLVKLARSGSMFVALSPQSMAKLRALRLLLQIHPRHPPSDDAFAQCDDDDDLVSALFDCVVRDVQHHTVWDRSVSCDVDFSVGAVLPSNTTLERLTASETPSKIQQAAKQELDKMEPRRLFDDESVANQQATTQSYIAATGLKVKSLAVIGKPLHSDVPHRASIQILSLPKLDGNVTEELGTATPSNKAAYSPGRAVQPNPRCCFGLYFPENDTLSAGPEVPSVIPRKTGGTFNSSRWLGVEWIAGSTVPQLGLVVGLSTSGLPHVETLEKDVRLRIGDVISLETTVAGGKTQFPTASFFVNGIPLFRIRTDINQPTHLGIERCKLAVLLCTGASVGLLSL